MLDAMTYLLYSAKTCSEKVSLSKRLRMLVYTSSQAVYALLSFMLSYEHNVQ
jgi:hypothetical protein